jgi:hypothetical protein
MSRKRPFLKLRLNIKGLCMTMKIKTYGIVLLCLFFQIIADAQTQQEVCHVSGIIFTEGIKGKPVYFTEGIRQKPVYFGKVLPKFDEITTKSFVFPNTDIVITVSIKYDFFYDGTDAKPLGGSLDMWILEKGKENDSDSTDRPAMRESFVKKFGGMKTAGQTIWKDKIYSFIAFCSSETKTTSGTN